MDPRTLELLELPEILDRLASVAASEPGKACCLALAPAAEPEEVERRQALTAEAVRLLDESAEPELAEVRDVRRDVEVAARGSTLDTATLRAIAVSIDAGIAARTAIETFGDAPGLAELVFFIEPSLARVSEPIARAVEDDGSDLRDTASPGLRRLRREVREGRGRIAQRLRALARDPSLREHLSEDFVTERAGRPVLALRASARGAVPGIVHDSSGSGQTLFVEPFAVVEDSNQLREAESAEREEVARILRELSSTVGDGAEAIVVSNHGGRQLDGVLSTARALPPIVAAVGERLTVLADSGVRSGLSSDGSSSSRPMCAGSNASCSAARMSSMSRTPRSVSSAEDTRPSSCSVMVRGSRIEKLWSRSS